MSHDTFYITTPIYYVNDKPHIGHAYTTILADVLARYHRLLGDPTYFLTGTDEHGQKVKQAADANNITPQQQCDQTVVRFEQLWERLQITHDDFIRTTQPRHISIVQQILQDLYDRGEIYQASYEGWYCVPCERFYTEKDLVDQLCPECGRDVDKLIEQNYFFRMSAYQQWLIAYIQEHPQFIQPEHRRQETLGFLRQPLSDLCISRPKSRLSWGIELPFDKDYVTYVWFDALVNYISGVGYGRDPQQFAQWWPASYHLIGKDILTTHTVYWPTMLKAMGLEMPKTVFAHGWWLVGRTKMSKSLGNVVNPMQLADTYGIDAFRYFLLAEMTLGQDASFTEENFIARYNAELANDLGNLVSRAVKMIQRNLQAVLPRQAELTADEDELKTMTLAAVTQMQNCVVNMQLNRGLAEVNAAVRACNRYFESMAPWTLAKTGDTAKLERVLYHAAEALRIISGLLFPVMPAKMAELRLALGLSASEVTPQLEKLGQWGLLPAERRIADPGSLFPRIEVKEVVPEAAAPATAAPELPVADVETPGLIAISDFAAVKLKTARVLTAEAVAGTDKLLRLEIELGAQRRQLVAGIAQSYTVAQIIGKTVVVVANLQPATIRGIKSEGMLLAAKAKDGLRIVTIDGDVPTGTEVG